MKNRLMAWGLLFLIVINVTALITFAYRIWSAKKEVSVNRSSDKQIKVLQKELNLNKQQLKQFRTFIRDFKIESTDILDSLKSKEKRLMKEVMSKQPDTLKIHRVIEDIGALQVAFKKKAISYLLLKKSILTPPQQRKFIRLISERYGKKSVNLRNSSAAKNVRNQKNANVK